MTSKFAPLVLAVLWFGCDAQEPGIEVAVKTSAAAAEGGAHALVLFRQGDGGLEVSHLHLGVHALELVECPDLLASLLLGTAYAHAKTSPLRLEAPHMIDAARTSTVERTLGVLRPPPGRYCGLLLIFGPADEAGRTLVMQGLDWQEGQPRAISLETRMELEVEVELDRPLVLSSEYRAGEVAYRFELATTLAGFSAASGEEMRAKVVLENLARSARASARGGAP